MKPAELWRLTWAEFFALYAGWQRRNARQWEQTREVLAMVRNVNAEQSNRLPARELLPLLLIDGPPPVARVFDDTETTDLMARFGLKTAQNDGT